MFICFCHTAQFMYFLHAHKSFHNFFFFCSCICRAQSGLFVPILPVVVCVCVPSFPSQCQAKGPSGSCEGHCFTVPQPDSWWMDSFSCYPASTVLHHIPLQKKKKTLCIPPSSHHSPTDTQALQRRCISPSR